MGNSDSKLSPYQLSDEELQAIPTIIRMTYQSSWRKYACCFTSRNISLGPPDAEPMYTLSFPRGLYGDIIIHKGPNSDSTPVATSSRIKQYHDDYLITLPSPTGNGVHEETLRRPQGLKGRFWFGCLVGKGPEQRVERFEWRRSRGAEVKSVGQSRWGGYKLVRLGSTDTKEDYSSSEDDLADEKSSSGEGYTSDGKEIVAVWGNASCWKTMSGVGELQFRGSGATGELGNMWALMTVMSCMSIWQKVQRDNATAGASASSASASSAAVAAAVS